MLEVYLKSPGIIFVKPNGKLIRTPIKFKIQEGELSLYNTMIKASSVTDYSIELVLNEATEIKPVVSPLSKTRPKNDLNLKLSIKTNPTS